MSRRPIDLRQVREDAGNAFIEFQPAAVAASCSARRTLPAARRSSRSHCAPEGGSISAAAKAASVRLAQRLRCERLQVQAAAARADGRQKPAWL